MRTDDLSSELLDVLPLAMREIRNEMRRLAKPGLTVAQFRILSRLDIRAQSNKELSEWMGISAASLSRTIDVLVARGFVDRRESEQDRREVALRLTAKGKRRYDGIEMATRKVLTRRLSQLSDLDRKKLQGGLDLIRRIFDQVKKTERKAR